MQSDANTISTGDVPAAILAGGLATRLGAVAGAAPKAMLSVAGRPFIDHQLSLLGRNGVRKVVMCVGHLSEAVERHVSDGSAHGLQVQYSRDGAAAAGTGGAIARALPLLGDLFWVMYGDSYMEIDYAGVLQSFARASDPAPLGLMTVIRNENRWDRSNVLFDQGRLACYDKRAPRPAMRFIDYGVQLLRRRAISEVSLAPPWDLSDLYHELVEEGQMVGHEVFQRFYEIGTPEALEQARVYLESRRPMAA